MQQDPCTVLQSSAIQLQVFQHPIFLAEVTEEYTCHNSNFVTKEEDCS